ncbi:MAG: DEAD/DEAH box helicase [Flavobacteriales bacterium]
MNYSVPTEIQKQAIPTILSGRDLIGIAQTGTGKTAAYLLPLLQCLKYAQGTDSRALILVPTKELAIQVHEAAIQFSKYTDLRTLLLIGGMGPREQIKHLEAGCDMIVSTPGRFLELYGKGNLVVKKIKHLVLDECDRLMDMGFWPQLRRMQETMPQKKQLLLFSATFPQTVRNIADNFMLFPEIIEITPQATPAVTVDHCLYEVPNFRTKLELLVYHLQHPDASRVMVFVKTREKASQVNAYLQRLELGKILLLNANKSQSARTAALESFRAGEAKILVTTDISARGIDVEDVSHVINLSVPSHHEDYVHRIGRTGRAGKSGIAITMADISEIDQLNRIEELIRMKVRRENIPSNVVIHPTSREERQEQLRELDRQRRRNDPTFKGAFHEKKFKKTLASRPSKKSRK